MTRGQRDPSRGLPSPAEEKLWTTRADGRVRPRLHPACPQPPYTVHRMFSEALDKYGDLHAMGFKRQGTWEHISYTQYYQLARKAAKGFLKVRALETQPSLPSPAFRLWTPVGLLSDPQPGETLGRITVKPLPCPGPLVHAGPSPRASRSAAGFLRGHIQDGPGWLLCRVGAARAPRHSPIPCAGRVVPAVWKAAWWGRGDPSRAR